MPLPCACASIVQKRRNIPARKSAQISDRNRVPGRSDQAARAAASSERRAQLVALVFVTPFGIIGGSVTVYLIPVVAIVLGVAFRNEAVTLLSIAGIVLVPGGAAGRRW